ncbi:MAG: serine hydrolase domain-containing protein [Pseudomonadales bacterium]|nr:serine hydrolase domain-containing protein [Pseudomonadales bacterium]
MVFAISLGAALLLPVGSADDGAGDGAGENQSVRVGTIADSHGSGRVLRDEVSSVPGQINFDSYIDWLNLQINEAGLPGAAMAIVSSRDILAMNTWGIREVGKQGQVDQQTVFRIASISKTFAGTVAAQLVNNDLYDWDEPLFKILPQNKFAKRGQTEQISLRHLMSHTTGLMPHAYSNMLDAGVGYSKIQEKFQEIPVVCPPGKCYGYQNVVFSLVADVVQTRTESDYSHFLVDNIFTPLGMADASVGLDSYLSNSNASSAHQRTRGGWRVAKVNPAYYSVAPASGVNASIRDMSRWAQANLGAFPEVLSREMLAIQHKPVVETPRGNYFNRWPRLDKAYYALGWRVFDYAGIRVIHHGGGVRGFRSELALIPEFDLGVVVLFNAESSVANDVIPGFLDLAIDTYRSLQTQL